MKRLFPKKVYRQVQESKIYNPGKDRAVNGFGYTIIPNDLDRDAYLLQVYQTGRVMIITSDNEIWKDVLVPNHLIDDLTFPQNAGEYGDLISWSSAIQFNQVQITGKYNKPGQFHPYLENVAVKRYPSPHSVVRVVNGNIPSYSISVEGERGEIEFKSKSAENTSAVSIKSDGTIQLTADERLRAIVENEVEFTVGDKKQLYIDKDKVVLGDGDEPLVLGNKFVDLMTQMLNQIAAITVTAAGFGTPTSVPANAAAFQQIAQQLQDLLSETSFTK